MECIFKLYYFFFKGMEISKDSINETIIGKFSWSSLLANNLPKYPLTSKQQKDGAIIFKGKYFEDNENQMKRDCVIRCFSAIDGEASIITHQYEMDMEVLEKINVHENIVRYYGHEDEQEKMPRRQHV